MKKLIKIICLIAGVVVLSCIAFACGGDESGGGGSKKYFIEAESMNLDDFQGLADSASPRGANAILGANSNAPQACLDSLNKKKMDGTNYNEGHFVGFFNGINNSFTFTFESDTDAKAAFSLRLGSEFGNLKYNPGNLTIKVNSTAISFNEFTISGPSGGKWGDFKDYAISTEIDLRKNDLTGENNDVVVGGEVKVSKPLRIQNTIEIILGSNNYWPATVYAGGFGIDCLKLTTTANITWEDYWIGGWIDDWDSDENEPITRVGNKDMI